MGLWVEPPVFCSPSPPLACPGTWITLVHTRPFCLALHERQQLVEHGAWALGSGSLGFSNRLASYQLILSWVLSLSELQESEGNSDRLTCWHEGRPGEKTRTKLGTMLGAW